MVIQIAASMSERTEKVYVRTENLEKKKKKTRILEYTGLEELKHVCQDVIQTDMLAKER